MPRPTQADIDAGQAPYSRLFLWMYDVVILGIFCRYIWKCPSRFMLENYNRHISANHLDVGVGTGWHLDHCCFPSQSPRLALMDLNENCLDVTGRRLARYQPETYIGDAYEPFDVGADTFDSVAVNGLLHCLPGTMADKGAVFDHARHVLNAGGILFGCTILCNGVRKGLAAKMMMRVTNNNKAFTNLDDSLDGLRQELTARFGDVRIKVIGCMALFSAIKTGGQ